MCYSGGPLLRERPLRLGGLLSFFSESCFDGSQPSLQVLHSRLRFGGFTPFLPKSGLRR
jgi:hypothetical protein